MGGAVLEGIGEAPFGVDGEAEAVDDNGRGLLSHGHCREGDDGGHEAKKPETHMYEVRPPLWHGCRSCPLRH